MYKVDYIGFLRNIRTWVWTVACAGVLVTGCGRTIGDGVESDFAAPLYPDYGDGLVIPCNIAPLNFFLPDSFTKFCVEIGVENPQGTATTKRLRAGKRGVVFPPKYWTDLLREAYTAQNPIRLAIRARSASGRNYIFPPVHWHVADSIDPYLTYRLVQPTDGVYNELDLWERCMEDFSTRKLVSNSLMNHNCFNCHTYHNGDAASMSLHFRNPSNGTLLMVNGDLKKIRVPSQDELAEMLPPEKCMPLNLVYPAWHPGGDWIVFSTRIEGVGGYAAHKRFFNLLDTASNLVLYDVIHNQLVFDTLVWTEDFEETWPAWSADGEWLYFCRTAKVSADTVARYANPTDRVRHIYFDLVRVRFSAAEGRFVPPVEVLAQGGPGGSYSVPRMNPNGDILVYCRALFNSVPYHAYGDLLAMDKDGNAIDCAVLNSPESESWHEWSSNGKWLVFASKRGDGLYSLPYFSYFDGKSFHRPFLLPQQDPRFYQTFLKAFNLPTLVHNASPLTPQQAAELQKEGLENDFPTPANHQHLAH